MSAVKTKTVVLLCVHVAIAIVVMYLRKLADWLDEKLGKLEEAIDP